MIEKTETVFVQTHILSIIVVIIVLITPHYNTRSVMSPSQTGQVRL